MEASHDDFGRFVPRQWSVCDGDGNDGDEVRDLGRPGISDNASPGQSLPYGWPQDDASALECWPPDPDLNCFGLDLSVHQPLDYIDETNLPEIEPAPVMETTSPGSLCGATWTSSSAESAFTGSSATSETGCLSPYLLTQSPQVSTSQTDCTAYSGDDIKDPAMASIPGDLNGPPLASSQPTTGAPNTQHMTDTRPAGYSAREWRKQTKPEACQLCGKGHAFQADLNKHMAAHHPDLARAPGISTARHVCRCAAETMPGPTTSRGIFTQKHGRTPARRRRRAQMRAGFEDLR